jgi:hypothetical protein
MKALYCTECKSLVRLTSKGPRECECGKVFGKYRKDGKRAVASDNEYTLSVAIDNKSFKAAIRRMRWWKKRRPKSSREDYKSVARVIAWVRPNSGPGNPHTATLKRKPTRNKS